MDQNAPLIEALLERAAAPLCVIDAGEHVVGANRAWVQTFGPVHPGAAISELSGGAERLVELVARVRGAGDAAPSQRTTLEIQGGQRTVTVTALRVGAGTGALIELEPPSEDQKIERLIRMVAHDLRGPITVVMTQAQLLRRKPDRAELVTSRSEMIGRNCVRLDQAIGDLVDVIGLNTGRFVLGAGEGDLVALVRELLSRTGGTIDVTRVRADLPDQLAVPGDAHRLERLLANALEYVVRGTTGEVQLRLRRAEQRAEVVIGAVSMPESPPADRPLVPIDLGSRGYEPLNLFVARQLAEAHGGQLTLESNAQDELVRVLLPIARGAAG